MICGIFPSRDFPWGSSPYANARVPAVPLIHRMLLPLPGYQTGGWAAEGDVRRGWEFN